MQNQSLSGKKSNGKSILSELLKNAFGEYGVQQSKNNEYVQDHSVTDLSENRYAPKIMEKKLKAPRHWMLDKLTGIPSDPRLHKIALNKKVVAWLYMSGKIEVYRKLHHPKYCYRYHKNSLIKNRHKILVFRTTLRELFLDTKQSQDVSKTSQERFLDTKQSQAISKTPQERFLDTKQSQPISETPQDTFLEREYPIKVKWDSNPKGEELVLQTEGVTEKRIIWLKNILTRVYKDEFQENLLIEFGNAIEANERLQILKEVFSALFEENNVTILLFTRSFKFYSLKIHIVMRPREEADTEKGLNYYLKKMSALPSMYLED